MIANVGVVAFSPLLKMEVEDWDRIMAINLRGMMLQYKYAGIQLVKQGRGGRTIGMLALTTR